MVGRLIEDDERRLALCQQCKHNAGLLPPGQEPHLNGRQIPGDTKLPKVVPNLLDRQPGEFLSHDLDRCGEQVQLVDMVLGEHRLPTRCHVADLTRGRFHVAKQQLDQRRLARSVRTEHPDPARALDLARDAVEQHALALGARPLEPNV